jgi:hypothetical protein
MTPLLIRCPGCGASLSSAEAFRPGKLIDCPRCRLLFAPTPDDIPAAHGRGDAPHTYPSSSPYAVRRRRRKVAGGGLAGIAIAAVVVMALAGVVVGISVFALRGTPPAPAPSPASPLPGAVTPTGDEASPPSGVEVEDPIPAPRRPVPRLDDDPPG